MARDGALTSESLRNAVASELAIGRRPRILAVGSHVLEVRAVNILEGHDVLDELRASVPRVELDVTLGDCWELREE